MGSGRIPDREDGTRMDDSWFNKIRDAMAKDIVPRNATTWLAENLAGKLGAPSYAFLKAFIAQGYWDVGDIKMHHSYNGAAPPGEGWMLCDGRTISEANYDTEHGSGHWDSYVGTSPLDGLKLPDFDDCYAIGAAATTDDGSGAISKVGNINHQIDLGNHKHKWFTAANNASINDSTFDVDGNALPFSDTADKNSARSSWTARPGVNSPQGSMYTWKTLFPNISTSQDLQPDSTEYQFYMRVI